MDIDQRSTTIGGRGPRIILLGDGSEAANSSDQQWIDELDGSDESFDTSEVTEREDTPAPEPAQTSDTSKPTSSEEEQQSNQSSDVTKEQNPPDQSKIEPATENDLSAKPKNPNST